jgi:hypothetical protein
LIIAWIFAWFSGLSGSAMSLCLAQLLGECARVW